MINFQSIKKDKLTFIANDKFIGRFKKKESYLNAKKGYTYFSNITSVPKTIFRNVDGQMLMISDLIHDQKSRMQESSILKGMGIVLSRLHEKSRKTIPSTLYEFLIAQEYPPYTKEMRQVLKKYKSLFMDQYVTNIHGDILVKNFLFSFDKVYLIDFETYQWADHYRDFVTVFLDTCLEDENKFFVFLKGYFHGAKVSLSYERLYINVLMVLLKRMRPKNKEKKLLCARKAFHYYLKELLNRKNINGKERNQMRPMWSILVSRTT